MKASMAEMEAANQALEESLKEKENALQEITEELSKLRDQIKTLETIDQEIQEKKQGISSP
jgi:prefoldin subunit 5